VVTKDPPSWRLSRRKAGGGLLVTRLRRRSAPASQVRAPPGPHL